VVDADQHRVVGYHALTAALIAREQATTRAARGMSRHPIPAALLARLAVDVSVQGRGIGAWLLRDAMLRTLSASESVGIRVLLVHALDADARGFYERHGFEASPTDPLNLEMLMNDLRAAVDEGPSLTRLRTTPHNWKPLGKTRSRGHSGRRPIDRFGERWPFAAASQCRRRDSNPRYADDDSAGLWLSHREFPARWTRPWTQSLSACAPFRVSARAGASRRSGSSRRAAPPSGGALRTWPCTTEGEREGALRACALSVAKQLGDDVCRGLAPCL
jgi:N-acetylglutamate synthase-like GNAT family acetyltransferase